MSEPVPSRDASLPQQSDVVVIGAGLSGLTAARRLRKLGRDVAVIEAQDRIGGRVKRVRSESGESLEAGGEFIGLHMSAILGLVEELGLTIVPLPAEGKVVRLEEGERVVEAYPFETAPEVLRAAAGPAEILDAMARQIPVEAPWEAVQAAEWDSSTVATWLEANVQDPLARAMTASAFHFTGGDAHEISLLFGLWLMRSMGGWESWSHGVTHVVRTGTSGVVDALAAEIPNGIFCEARVRRVEHAGPGCVVHTDRGSVRCRVLVVAIAPQLCARISWEPALPVARDRLQSRYTAGHGVKFIALYDTPWWRDEGLSGLVVGDEPIPVMMDISDPDLLTGRLLGLSSLTSQVAGQFSEVLSDEKRAGELFIERAVAGLGPRAADFREVHVFNWSGDAFSTGAGVGLAPGVLSAVGYALREPCGPILWAGAEAGAPQCDWMEGAVSAGERAAREAVALL